MCQAVLQVPYLYELIPSSQQPDEVACCYTYFIDEETEALNG